jgi:autotransporter-associated beta strand protein
MSVNCKSSSVRVAAAACAVALSVASTNARAAIYTWDGDTDALWGTAANWDATPTFNNTADIVFSTSAVPNASTVTSAARTVRSLSFGANVDTAFNIATVTTVTAANGTAANLTMDTDSGSASITVDAGAAGNITIGRPTGTTNIGNLVLTDNLLVTHNGSGVLSVTRAISGTGFGITKSGSGTMLVSPSAFTNNTFSGPLNINQGRYIAAGLERVTTPSVTVSSDFNSVSAINLGGGTLEVRITANEAKNVAPPIVVSAASTLVYSNLNASSRILSLTNANGLTLNADLTVQNTSVDSTHINQFDIARPITGSGDLIISTDNNIGSSADNSNLRRVQLISDNTGWSGDLVIARGTGTLSIGTSNPTGTGTIQIGTAGDNFGAVLAFNQSTAVTVGNDIIVQSAGAGAGTGHRGIDNNGAGSTSVTFTGDVTLNSNLSIKHNIDSTRFFAFTGDISGTGGLRVTRTSTNNGSYVRLAGNNTYSGDTVVAPSGSGAFAGLILDGSLTSNISVSSGSRFGGDGSTSGTLTMASGSTFVFSTATTLDVVGTVTFDASFGVSSLVNADGSAINWSLVSPGTYTLIGSTPSTFNYISNFGLANAATVDAGSKYAYFQNGSLQLVVTPIPEPTTLTIVLAIGALATRRPRRH